MVKGYVNADDNSRSIDFQISYLKDKQDSFY